MTDVKVDEGEDVDLTFRLKRRIPGGSTTPLLLNAATDLKVVVKNAKADPDSSPKFTYTQSGGGIVITADGTAPNAQYSEIVVHVVGTDQTPPGNYYHHIDVITAGPKKETIDNGIWRITNT